MPRSIRRSPSQATPTVAFRVPAELHVAALELAEAQGVSISEIGRMAFEAFISNRRAGPTEGYFDARNRAMTVLRYMIETLRDRMPESVEEFDQMMALANEERPGKPKR